ncbi:MAG: lactonase family protein [Bryobacteraceae bacterium]
MKNRREFLEIAGLAALPAYGQMAPAREYRVYVGTGGSQSRGIYMFRLETRTGKATEPELAAEASNPNFLEIHPSRKFVYAVGDIPGPEGKKQGGVMAFSIEMKTGKLALLNQVSSSSAGPCHISVDKTGQTALVANYGGGTVAAFGIEKDGRLRESASVIRHAGKSVNPKRQEAPHPHSFNVSLDNRWGVAADLGLDQVLVYKLDPAKSTITPANPPFAKVASGAGPRHFAFHPSGKYGYVINEIGNTVTAFRFDTARGVLTEIQDITTLPAGFSGTSYTAEVRVHPNGHFLYGSNRGHDSIAVFAIDQATGRLKPVEIVSTQGKNPRNFNLDPSGTLLLAGNQSTDNIVIFRVDRATGKMTPTGQTLKVPAPICHRFLPIA